MARTHDDGTPCDDPSVHDDDAAQRIFEELRQQIPADVQSAMGGSFERVFKTLLEFAQRQTAKQDTVWDRDARAFTRQWMRSAKPDDAVRFAAAAADALATERARRRN